VIFLSESDSIMFFYCLFIYVLTLEIWLSRREGWDPIHCFTPKDQNCQLSITFVLAIIILKFLSWRRCSTDHVTSSNNQSFSSQMMRTCNYKKKFIKWIVRSSVILLLPLFIIKWRKTVYLQFKIYSYTSYGELSIRLFPQNVVVFIWNRETLYYYF
jgi:hypothetical protein